MADRDGHRARLGAGPAGSGLRDDAVVTFTVDQFSEPLHTNSRPDVAVYEVDLRNVRTGSVIASRDMAPEAVVEEIDTRAARRSYGVLCADLMLGVDLTERWNPGELARSPVTRRRCATFLAASRQHRRSSRRAGEGFAPKIWIGSTPTIYLTCAVTQLHVHRHEWSRSQPVHSLLGLHVRQRREGLRLSMDALAGRARISRSTLHRFEHGHPITLTPANAARVLAAVEITAREAEQLVEPCEWREELLIWMTRNGHLDDRVQEHQTNVSAALEFSLWRGREPRYVVTLEPLEGGNADEMVQLAEWIRDARESCVLRRGAPAERRSRRPARGILVSRGPSSLSLVTTGPWRPACSR